MHEQKKRPHSIKGRVVLDHFLEILDCPYSRRIRNALFYGDYDLLANLDWCPDDGPLGFFVKNAIKKYPFAYFNKNMLEEKAYHNWLALERYAYSASLKLIQPVRTNLFETCSYRDRDVTMIKNIVTDILGAAPSNDEWLLNCQLGSHSAIGATGRDAHPLTHADRMTYSVDAFGYSTLPGRLYDAVSMRGIRLSPVVGSELGFVPKTFKSLRTIGVEPSLNMFFQLGLGNLIRNKLKRVGVDLLRQDINQNRVFNGNVATLDLSNASDTINMGHLYMFVPDDWITLIEECRTAVCEVKRGSSRERFLQYKIAGMGCGFTFPLESLIFYAICKTACINANLEHARITVYGDDIVVPKEAFAVCSEYLSGFGLIVNNEKSFCEGLYHESCGVHVYDGALLRPVYVDKADLYVEDMANILNAILSSLAENIDATSYRRLRHLHSVLFALTRKTFTKIRTMPVLADLSKAPFRVLRTNMAIMVQEAEILWSNPYQLDGVFISASIARGEQVFKCLIQDTPVKHQSTLILGNDRAYYSLKRFLLLATRTPKPPISYEIGQKVEILPSSAFFKRRVLKPKYLLSEVFVPRTSIYTYPF